MATVNGGSERSYHCHICDIQFKSKGAICSQCGGEFVEEIAEDNILQPEPSISTPDTRANTSETRRGRPRERDQLGEMLGQYLLQLLSAREQLEDSENYTLPVIPPPPQFLELMFRSRNRSLPSGITVSSSTNLDSVVARLLERLSESEGPPPAEDSKIDSLPSFKVDQSLSSKEIECSICKDTLKLDDMCLTLPCTHFFHDHCITAWLKLRDTCPTCRYSLNKGKVLNDEN